jgi:endonuclease/exonuclease/phosphatase (EEP) superfamily protein YafD
MISRTVLAAALVVAAAATLAGMLAPVYPPADILTNFQPFTCVGAGLLLAMAVGLKAWRLVWGGAALLGLNAILLALPLLWAAEPAEGSTAGQALASAGGREIKVLTFNMRYGPPEPVARLLLEEDADIVVLQEIDPAQAARLARLLSRRYPHSHACGVNDRCGAALVAKRAWAAAGLEYWSENGPEVVWARFDDAELGKLRVMGVHLKLPLRPYAQANDVKRLVALGASWRGPTIVAGDFNMTPWSWRQQGLLAATGWRRHATLLRSWPTDGQFRLIWPTFLIDNVMTTPDITSVSVRIGPHTGSDHLPVIARLRLPGRP